MSVVTEYLFMTAGTAMVKYALQRTEREIINFYTHAKKTMMRAVEIDLARQSFGITTVLPLYKLLYDVQ